MLEKVEEVYFLQQENLLRAEVITSATKNINLQQNIVA